MRDEFGHELTAEAQNACGAAVRRVLGGQRWMCLRGRDAMIADRGRHHIVMANAYYLQRERALCHGRVPGRPDWPAAVHRRQPDLYRLRRLSICGDA